METLNDGFDIGPIEIAQKALVPAQKWQPKHSIITLALMGITTIVLSMIYSTHQLKLLKLCNLKKQDAMPAEAPDEEKSTT